jgi:hypothetical protein
MNRALRLACVTVAGALLVAGAMAQSVATGDLSGTVRDQRGAAVSNATVTARDESRAFERTTKTDTEGKYQILLLPPGHYTLTVEAAGFGRLVAKDVGVTVGQKAEYMVELKVATAVTEVTVTGEPSLVETQRSSSTTTIEQKRIDNLPINGRNYINFTLTDSQTTRDTAPSIGAAPTSGLNFGGQRALANLVNVDGADTVDASVNGIRSTVSQEAVQEFQIINNSYAAEYGRASGGVVNIITRSGSNAFHGTAFGFLRNRNFQATNPFSNVPNPAYTRVQAGFTLGGPIKKDKTFFFLSYETTRRHETGFSDVGRDCLGGTSCFALIPFDGSAIFPVPPGFLIMQVTPAQATFLANGAIPLAVRRRYAFLAGGGSGIALDGAMPAGFAALGLAPAGLSQFPSSCNPGNTVCAGLPGDFTPLNTQRGNYPVFEGTSLWSARLDHRFSNNNNAMLRANVSPSTQNGIQVNAQNQPFGQNAYSRTSLQQFRDFAITAQDTWLIGNNKINEFRFQYARRGLLYDFNTATPSGARSAVNIVGFAFIGREPFSFVRRVEQRYQVADNFSWVKGNHSFKFGGDFQRIPITAAFTVNFGNVYNFGALSAATFGFPATIGPFPVPGFPSVQTYGLGIPSTMVQGIGNPNAAFAVTPIGVFLQDSWRIRPNLTVNYGVRYDVELSPTFGFANALSAAAYNALGIQKGFGTDTKNVQPRLGIAWDPWKDGKTVFRANYGMFYDNPLLGLTFLGNATDGFGTPQVLLFGQAPCGTAGSGIPPGSPLNLTATAVFQGILATPTCIGPAAAGNMGYLAGQQRFDPFFANSTFINQNFLNPATFQPLLMQPFGFPTGKGFQHAYAQQAGISFEHDFGSNFALSISYNYTHGVHLNRPINANPVRGDLLAKNWARAVIFEGVSPTVSPLAIGTGGTNGTCNPGFNVYPAPLVNFFRPSGINPSLAPVFGGGCTAAATAFLTSQGLGLNAPTCTIFAITTECTPFSDMVANYSNGSSVYHGLTAQLRKRFSRKYEFLASYTWSHTIDDSTDLQSLLSPQDSYFPSLERANSTFDQRHRFVFSGMYQSGKLSGDGFWSKVFSDWTVSPIIEFGSGRPFTILTAEPVNFQFSPNDARPNVVPAGTPTNACGFPAQPSPYSPTGFFQTPCFIPKALAGTITLADLDGNLGRNSATRPATVFTDFRFARRFHLGERVKLDAISDMFNLINRNNTADVSLLCSSTSCNAGKPAAAFDPRQFQFALKLSF